MAVLWFPETCLSVTCVLFSDNRHCARPSSVLLGNLCKHVALLKDQYTCTRVRALEQGYPAYSPKTSLISQE
jgi:hypothetical protein